MIHNYLGETCGKEKSEQLRFIAAFAVLGDFRLDGFRQPAGFCGHAAGAAFGCGNAGAAARGRGGIYG